MGQLLRGYLGVKSMKGNLENTRSITERELLEETEKSPFLFALWVSKLRTCREYK